jgi:ribosomal protein S18 acetylase RimI-like enzyme
MKIKIKTAGPDDTPFLAWVMLTATRSHLNYGVWEHFVGGTEQDCLSFLNCIATTQQTHLFHYSAFKVAERNGQKVGALSGYDPVVSGMKAFTQSIPEVFQKLGWSRNKQKAAFERYLPWTTCAPDDSEGAWIVESVAVLPKYRRQGIISALLDEVLETGKRGGYTLAQIGVLINNTPADWSMRNKDSNLKVKKEILNSKLFLAVPV